MNTQSEEAISRTVSDVFTWRCLDETLCSSLFPLAPSLHSVKCSAGSPQAACPYRSRLEKKTFLLFSFFKLGEVTAVGVWFYTKSKKCYRSMNKKREATQCESAKLKNQPSQLEITERRDLNCRLNLNLRIKKVDHLLWLMRSLKGQ